MQTEHRAFAVAAALVTAYASNGCSAASSPSEDDAWREVADARGFTDALEGKDFFAAAHFGCVVDTSKPPDTMQALAAESDLIVLATIVEVVAVPEQPPSDQNVNELIRLRVEIEDTLKGASEPSILVVEDCGTGGKVAPLRDRIPAESFLFFLDGPAQVAGSEPLFHLMYYHLGIVAETAGGVRFALDASRSSPPLAEFDSLQALADVVSAPAP